MSAELLRARADAHEQAESLGLLDAVLVIARSGSRLHGTQFVKDWEGLRLYCGERNHPYAEVHKLTLSKEKPVHEPPEPGKPFLKGNPDHAVTAAEMLYEHSDLDGGTTRCFRQGPWIDKVLSEAKRIAALPPSPKVAPSTAEHFAPYEGK